MRERFVYDETMPAGEYVDTSAARIAAAIGEPARSRILFSLMDGHARTSTELAVVANVSPSTASVHLNRLLSEKLVKVFVQGKHRYYSLQGPEVAALLEGLAVLAGSTSKKFEARTPEHLRIARSCYDHIAGSLGVQLHDRFKSLGWIDPVDDQGGYALRPPGVKGFESLGLDVTSSQLMRRRFACACLDWSERRPHLGGALAAALLHCALKKKWLRRHLNDRALSITCAGQREIVQRFDIHL